MMEKPRNDFSIERVQKSERERDDGNNVYQRVRHWLKINSNKANDMEDDANAVTVDYDGSFMEDLDSLSMATTNI